MALRALVVDRDAGYAAWLRHHLDASWPGAQVRIADLGEFEHMRLSITRREFDLLLLGAAFGEDPASQDSEGLEALRKLRDQPGLPPIVALAEDGNELIAVRALKLGAADYVPKRLLTAARLAATVRIALHAGKRRRPGRAATLAAAAPTLQAATLSSFAGTPPVIPRYTILRTLGESDKATVYLAHSEELDREVALKVGRRAGEDPGAPQLFAREYAAIAALNHPSIVDIYDYGMHGGHEFLAMEYFPRGDLKARLQQPISPAESLVLVRRIAAALAVVHAAGLVHRDLKPANVMLRDSGDIVLIDFGLARGLDQTDGSTRVGTLRGSPYYMSPEQAEGRVLDSRTDLYSLGVMLYEMLAGKKPYTGVTALEVLQQHVQAPVPHLPGLLAEHQALLDRLMAKDRTQRIGSAEELLNELEGAGAGEPIAAQAPVAAPALAVAG